MHRSTQAVRNYRRTLYSGRQVQAAQDAGISQPYLSQLESGKRQLTAETAWRIEDGWGLQPNELAELVRSERAAYPRRYQRKEVFRRCAADRRKHLYVTLIPDMDRRDLTRRDRRGAPRVSLSAAVAV